MSDQACVFTQACWLARLDCLIRPTVSKLEFGFFPSSDYAQPMNAAPVPPACRPIVTVIGSFVQANCWYVHRLPKPGESIASLALHTEAGGKGLNVGVGMARLGASVTMVIATGADGAGQNLRELLRTEHIDTQYVY